MSISATSPRKQPQKEKVFIYYIAPIILVTRDVYNDCCPFSSLSSLPRATHPLFHTQTSVTAAGQSPRESYRVGSVVGEGHYVVVRDCHHKVTGQHYSLRVINKAGVFGHEDLVLRECQLLRGLKHDNLVQMVDGWESSDEICLVAEHIEVSLEMLRQLCLTIFLFKPLCLPTSSHPSFSI